MGGKIIMLRLGLDDNGNVVAINEEINNYQGNLTVIEDEEGFFVNKNPKDYKVKISEGSKSITLRTSWYELSERSISQTRQKVTELELENADLWYDTMIKDMKLSDHETEIAMLWYEIMMGGSQ